MIDYSVAPGPCLWDNHDHNLLTVLGLDMEPVVDLELDNNYSNFRAKLLFKWNVEMTISKLWTFGPWDLLPPPPPPPGDCPGPRAWQYSLLNESRHGLVKFYHWHIITFVIGGIVVYCMLYQLHVTYHHYQWWSEISSKKLPMYWHCIVHNTISSVKKEYLFSSKLCNKKNVI